MGKNRRISTRIGILVILCLGLAGCGPVHFGGNQANPTGAADKTPTDEALPGVTPTARPAAGQNIPAAVTPAQTALPTVITPTIVSPPAPPGWIFFASYEGDSSGIDVINTSGRGWRRVIQADSPEEIALSPDGNWIAWHAGHNLYIAHPDGRNLTQLTQSNAFNFEPSWSPDSQMLVFNQTTQSTNLYQVDLYTINVYTRELLRLTNSPAEFEHYPAWSPQGDKIAFVSVQQGENPYYFHLMVMDADGDNLTRIATGPLDVRQFAWSPDGSQIYISAGERCKDLYKINLDGSGLQQVTENPGDIYDPSLAPGGDWISFAYSACTGGFPNVAGQQIYLMRADGQGLKLLTDQPDVSAIDPAWYPLPGLQTGQTYTVTDLGNNLNLRAAASRKSIIQLKIPKGEEIQVLEGPVEADDYLWWRVRVPDRGQEGWVAENPGWFAPAQDK